MTSPAGEFKPGDEKESPVSFKNFLDTLQEWVDKPWNGDEGIQAFSQALINILPPNIADIVEYGADEIYENASDEGRLSPEHEFVQMVANYVTDHDIAYVDAQTSVNASYKGRKLYHAVRYAIFMMKNEDLMRTYFDDLGVERPSLEHQYPDDFDKPEAFEELFRVIASNPSLGDLVVWALERFQIRTTVIPRYLIPRLELVKEFGDQPIKIGSVGVGSGHGEKALVSNFEFDDIEVVEQAGLENEFRPSEEASALVNSQKNRRLNIEHLYGFDIYGIKDVAQSVWMDASLLLREHKDEKFMEKRKKLSGLNDERLEFHMLDFTDDEAVDEFLVEFIRERGGEPDADSICNFMEDYKQRNGNYPDEVARKRFYFDYARDHGAMPELDVFLAITVLYQLKTEEERNRAYINMAKFVKDDGFIIIQDSIDGSFRGNFNYVSIKSYPHHPEIPPHLIALAHDDRCRQIIIKDNFDLED